MAFTNEIPVWLDPIITQWNKVLHGDIVIKSLEVKEQKLCEIST